MQILRTASVSLTVLAGFVAVGDLVYQGIARAVFALRSASELLTDLGFGAVEKSLQSFVSPQILDAPASVALLLLAAVFYVAYRLVSLAQGHDRSRRL